MFAVGRVNYVAESEAKMNFFQFRWSIKQFKKFLEKPKNKYDSPIFEQKEEENVYQWKLLLGSQVKSKRSGDSEGCQYLPIKLVFIDGQVPAAVTFYVGIMDSNENIWMQRNKDRVFVKPNEDCGWSGFIRISALLDSKNNLLHDDTLKLYCQIWIELETEHEMKEGYAADIAEKGVQREDDFFCDVQNLLASSMLTDVVIQTKDKTLKVHKAILACRSSVFKATFQNEMFECIDNTVKIFDFDEPVVSGMLEYIYRFGNTKRRVSILMAHLIFGNAIVGELHKERATEFLQIAEKYDIKGLKEASEEIIIMNISVKNAADCLVLADANNALNLKAKAIEFININKDEVVKTEGFEKLMAANMSLFMDLYMQKTVTE